MAPKTRFDDRVAITGIGAVSGYGWSAAELWQGLASGQTSIRAATQLDTSGQRTAVASEVPEPAVLVKERRWSRADHFAIAATAEAVAQARQPGGCGGVFFGGSTAAMREGERFFASLIGTAGEPVHLALLASHPLNGPADAVARAFDVDGPVETASSACASGALALGMALRAVRSGEVDYAIAGGADALCTLTYSGFNALRAVDSAPALPFRAQRMGLSLGEGAGILILELAARARERGVHPLALLLGAGGSCDAHHMTAPHPEGRGAAQAIRHALDDAALAPEAVSFVNAHGTGTPHNDLAEWRALLEVFTERARTLPVTSTKGAVGHLLGSAGALEAVATVQCLVHRCVHATPGNGAVDPEAPVDLVLGAPRPLPSHAVALSTNLAFGGSNAAILLASADEAGA